VEYSVVANNQWGAPTESALMFNSNSFFLQVKNNFYSHVENDDWSAQLLA